MKPSLSVNLRTVIVKAPSAVLAVENIE